MDLKDFKTSKKAENEGVWEDMGDGCEFLIARIGNEKYRKYSEKLFKPHQYAIRKKTLGNEKAQEILNELMAECILLGWRGLKDEGKPVKYSKEECLRILTEVPEVYKAVYERAESIELFQREMDVEAEKNLKKP